MKLLSAKKANAKTENPDRQTRRIPLWSIGVMIGVICLVLGARQNQFADIYRKAVMICLECIGIG